MFFLRVLNLGFSPQIASTFILSQIGRYQALIPRVLQTKCSEPSGKVASPDSKQQMFIKNSTKYF